EDAIDSFYAFAQACHHLVDWLENDPAQHVRRQQAEAYVAGSRILTLCQDICNGAKHARLKEKKVRTTSTKTATSLDLPPDESGESRVLTSESTELFVEWDGEPVSIETFGGWCVEEWNKFLIGEGL